MLEWSRASFAPQHVKLCFLSSGNSWILSKKRRQKTQQHLRHPPVERPAIYTNYIMDVRERAGACTVTANQHRHDLPAAFTHTTQRLLLSYRVRSANAVCRALTWSAPPLEPHGELCDKRSKCSHHILATQNIRLDRSVTQPICVKLERAATRLPLRRSFRIKEKKRRSLTF